MTRAKGLVPGDMSHPAKEKMGTSMKGVGIASRQLDRTRIMGTWTIEMYGKWEKRKLIDTQHVQRGVEGKWERRCTLNSSDYYIENE